MRSIFKAFARAFGSFFLAVEYGAEKRVSSGGGIAATVGAALFGVAATVSIADTIVIGQVLPLTGPLANVGKDIERSTRAHFDLINQRGGVNGRKLELFTEDDGNDAKVHAVAVTSLLKRGVVAFVNCFGTVGCMAEANALKATQVPLIGPIAGAPALRAADVTRVFALRPAAQREIAHLVEYANRIGLKRVAVYVQDDGFGRGYFAPAQAAFKAANVVAVVEVVFAPATPDYASDAARIVTADAEAVLMLANVTHSVGLIRAIRAKSANPYILNLAGQANAGFVKALQGESALAAFAAFTPNPWSERAAISKEYRDAIKAFSNEENYSFLSLEAYINAKMLTTALKSTRASSSEQISGALSAMRDVDLGGFSAGYGAGRRDASSFVDLAVMTKTGRFAQ
jgi:branched-chain amino acid transport system substrate-binding protein